MKRILSFSDILDGALPTFDQVNYVAGPVVRSGFNPKLFTCASVAKPATHSDVSVCLAVRLFALASTLVRFLKSLFICSD